MRSRFTELVKELANKGWSMEDIDKIVKLRVECLEECENIAEQCEEEGYPSHGCNYDLRCESIREWYNEQEDAICAKYE